MRLLHLEYETREDEVTVAFLTDPDFHTPNAFVRSICQAFEIRMRRSLQAPVLSNQVDKNSLNLLASLPEIKGDTRVPTAIRITSAVC